MSKSVNFRPSSGRVLVKRIDQESKSAGGIIIPDTAKEKPIEGEVVAIGSGTRDEKGVVHPMEVKVGDKVLFAKWGGNEIKLDGQEYIILKEGDVLGVIGQ